MTKDCRGGHQWEIVWNGEYDTLYKCSCCKKEHFESGDNIKSWLKFDKNPNAK